ncbi:hypothetical protein WM40_20825 [Robbsia andropogonis]|uniref:Mandelate racemase/muconate lactonizing enzyme C-terminal domain-containing protein n=1 Tax=Robbsia andropogonis TaxID=28092 RepID=A0A0F5JX50_9BURK|nr:enolase C-terminal domain-like protein [Robbsia andropogonis]KKB61847.1 hypothetical protein WM40_20825 [Robbsia andropogonis]
MSLPRNIPSAAISVDSIAWIGLTSGRLPLATATSDAKLLTGRQKPMTEIAMLFAQIETRDGHRGLGFSYSKRGGGEGQFAHAAEIAPALMIDANQQWDCPTAQRMCRTFEPLNLIWIKEPLDCYDVDGHAALAATFDTPIATGEMLRSLAEHRAFIQAKAADFLMPDGPRVGGITPFLKVAALAEEAGIMLAPHFAMELHVHLAACYPTDPWVEHFERLEPSFNERIETHAGRMIVPTRPGVGLSLSDPVRG